MTAWLSRPNRSRRFSSRWSRRFSSRWSRTNPPAEAPVGSSRRAVRRVRHPGFFSRSNRNRAGRQPPGPLMVRWYPIWEPGWVDRRPSPGRPGPRLRCRCPVSRYHRLLVRSHRCRRPVSRSRRLREPVGHVLAHLMARRLVAARLHCPLAAARRPGVDPVSRSLVPALDPPGPADDLAAGPVPPAGAPGPVPGAVVVAARNSSRWTPLPTLPTTPRCPRGKWSWSGPARPKKSHRS